MPTNHPSDEASRHTTAGASERPRIDPDAVLDDMEGGAGGSWERFEASPGRTRSEFTAESAEHGAVVSFLENQLRQRPLPTLLAAVAAGWLVGKLLR